MNACNNQQLIGEQETSPETLAAWVMINEQSLGEQEEKNELSDSENNLNVLAFKQIECKCQQSNLMDDKLYLCEHQKCLSVYYCASCGPFYHESKKLGLCHSFDINSSNVVELHELMNKKEDIEKFNDGKQLIIDLIGYERYKRIAPYVKTTSIGVSNAGILTELMYDLKDFYNTASLAIKANHAANKAAIAAKTAADALKHAEQAKDITSQVCIYKPWTWSWGEKIQSTDVANLNKAAEEAENIALQTKDAANIAHNSAESALKKAISLDNSVKTMKAGLYGLAIATSIEMCIHSYRWYNGNIDGKEWCRLFGKAFVRNTGSLVGTGLGSATGIMLSVKVGTVVASATLPGIGTAVGCGAGIIVGMVSGYLMGKGAEAVYEQYFPENEKEAKSKIINEALLYFNFQKHDIENDQIFNDKILRKLFRQKSLYAHPDRRAGDYSEWQRLSTYYGILRGLWEEKQKPKNKTNQKIIKNAINALPNIM